MAGEEDPFSAMESFVGAAPRRYRGFICHSHEDRRLARRLHARLESYRIPRGLNSYRSSHGVDDKNRFKLGRFFIDDSELAASANLGPTLCGALDDSEILIVIASRVAAGSNWVNKEVSHFKSRPGRPILG
jgi:hypothetical protein